MSGTPAAAAPPKLEANTMSTASRHWNAAALPAAVKEVESSIQSPCPKLWSEEELDARSQPPKTDQEKPNQSTNHIGSNEGARSQTETATEGPDVPPLIQDLPSVAGLGDDAFKVLSKWHSHLSHPASKDTWD